MGPNNESYRVAHLVNQMDHGVAAGDLTKALNEHTDFRSTVISLQKPSGIPDQVPVIYAPTNEHSFRASPSRIRWISDTLREFDLITTHHTFAGLIGSLVATAQRKPIVAREGNNHRKFPLKVRVARTVTGLLADEIVCVSQSVANSYSGFERIIPKSKIEVITNGVDVEKIQSAKNLDWSIHQVADIDPDASIVGTAGMLIRQKNHETLIQSIERLRTNRSTNVELVIAGEGPKRKYLETIVRDLAIEEAVHFLGYLNREQVYRMMHEIDCYAMPSLWEGFSVAALQAMAVGVPCVFSDIPSFRSQFPNSIALFHTAESVSDLEKSIFNVLDGKQNIENNNVRYIKENHTLKSMTYSYAEKYHELLNN